MFLRISAQALTLLLALGWGSPTQAQTWPSSTCYAAVVTKLMMEKFRDGACPTYQLTMRGREMYMMAGNVVQLMSARDQDSECLREGTKKYDATVMELESELNRNKGNDDVTLQPCRVVALFLDGLAQTIPGEPYYQLK